MKTLSRSKDMNYYSEKFFFNKSITIGAKIYRVTLFRSNSPLEKNLSKTRYELDFSIITKKG
jgi:hypothetical protein